MTEETNTATTEQEVVNFEVDSRYLCGKATRWKYGIYFCLG